MAYTDTSALGGLVKTAYDRYVEFALRAQPMIRAVADKKPVQQAMPGSSVVFSLYNDLAAATSTLTETTDPDAVALSDVDTVSVTLNEYGNASLVTRKLQLFSLSDVDPAVADIIAFNMADSLDIVAQNTLRQAQPLQALQLFQQQQLLILLTSARLLLSYAQTRLFLAQEAYTG
jgi:hypothetical protein